MHWRYNVRQHITVEQIMECGNIGDTYTHFSESGSMDPNCILLLATSKGYLVRKGTTWHIKHQLISVVNSRLETLRQPEACWRPADNTYDIAWAMAPAIPPQSRLTCVFRTQTSGLSEDGRPSISGKCFKPRLFRVPKVKNEKPGG